MNSKEGERSIDDLFEQGLEFIRSKQYQEALDCFKKVAELDPHYEKVWFHMGYVYGNQYLSDEAIDCYEKALELDPEDYEAWYNLGNEYLDYGDPLFDDPWEDNGLYAPAIECYKKALEIKPDFSFAWNNLGFAYFKLKEYEKSVEGHHKALEFDPDNENALINLGSSYHFSKEYVKAINIFEEAYERYPDNPNSQLVFRASLEAYLNRKDINDENKEKWLRVGIDFLKLNQTKQAIKCFKLIIEQDHTYYDAWHQLGIVYNYIDDHDEFMFQMDNPEDLIENPRRIFIITTSQGPIYPDVFWLLENDEGISIIPSEGQDLSFLSKVQELPGFNNKKVIEAMQSTENNSFLCWEREKGEK